MFSELIKREVTKLMLVIFIHSSISPAFASQRVSPDFIINIQRQQMLNEVTQTMVAGFAVQVMQRQAFQRQVTQTIVTSAIIQTAYAYKTIFDQVVAPFMVASAMHMSAMARLYEILQTVKATVITESPLQLREESEPEPEPKPEESATEEIETQLSRGFCLNIPELGDLLISHEGDVVFDSGKFIGKSLKITAPSQVILNDTRATDIEVEAAAAVLTGKTKTSLKSLVFRGSSDASGPESDVANALFVDKESELEVEELSLEDALLLNTGRLTVKQTMNLNGGYLFNTGIIATKADPSVLQNIAYLYNTGQIEAAGKLVIGASNVSNSQTIRARELEIITPGLLDNFGTLESEISMELSGSGSVVNHGMMNGKSGSVTFSSDKFEQRAGEIRAAKVSFNARQNVLTDGTISGQEAFFTGDTTNSASLIFQKGTVDGVFQNSSKAVTFASRLELTGRRAEIQNTASGKITTSEITSNAETGLISGGEFSPTFLDVRKHLQIEAELPQLKRIRIYTGAKLLFSSKAKADQLESIDNSGESRILTSMPELSNLQNSATGHLQIETPSSLPKLRSLDHLQGRIDIKATLPNLTRLNLQSGTILKVLGFSDFSGLTDLTVQRGAEFLAEEYSRFTRLSSLTNFGTATFKTQTMGLSFIHNGQDATLHLLDKSKVVGGKKDKTTMLAERKPTIDALPWIDQFNWMNDRKFENIPSIMAEIFNEALRNKHISSESKALELARTSTEDSKKSYAVCAIAVKEMLKDPTLTIGSATQRAGEICERYGISGATKFISNSAQFLDAVDITQAREIGEPTTADQLRKGITRWRDSFANTAETMEVEFKGGQPTAAEYLRSVRSCIKCQAHMNYVLIKVTAKELAKNPVLPLKDTIQNASKICAENGISVSWARIYDAEFYLGKMDVSKYSKQGNVVNEGKILVRHKAPTGEGRSVAEGGGSAAGGSEYQDIEVKGKYIGTENSVLRYENGARTLCADYINYGMLYSPTRFRIVQHGTVTKWGKAVDEDGIVYVRDGGPFSLTGELIRPVVNGHNKTLKIISRDGINITVPVNMNVDLDIETPAFQGNSDLTVRSFKAKTTTFHNTKTISARDSIDIETRDFTNTSGRLQTYGGINFRVHGQFRNTGGGRLEKSVPETIPYYSWNGSGLSYYTTTIYRDLYYPDLGKAGVITCGKLMNIWANLFDNSFGILNASEELDITSLTEIVNECGLIYCGGTSTLSGTRLRNGYRKGPVAVTGSNPNAPIRSTHTITGRGQWVTKFITVPKRYHSWGFHHTKYVQEEQRIWEALPNITETETIGYYQQTQYSRETKYPGYIFSVDDLMIKMASETYLGTIVSGGNVYIGGSQQGSISQSDRGLLVVKGNVTLELQKAALAQLAIQAENIYFKLLEDMAIRGIIQPVLMPDGSVSQLIDLRKLGEQLGFLLDGKTFSEQGTLLQSPTTLVPISGRPDAEKFSIFPTSDSGFIGKRPRSRFFMPTVQSSILNHLITLTLAPLEGRDILLNIDLFGELRRKGARLAETFRGVQSIVLPGGNPAILFDKSQNPDIEVEIDGETVLVPLFNPYLICNTLSRLKNIIQAQHLISIQTLGDIRLEPGEFNLESEDLTLDSAKQIQIAADFTFSETKAKTGVTPVVLDVPGTLKISGARGVQMRGASLSARKMEITSSSGDVVALEMQLDPTYTFTDDKTCVKQQESVVSSLKAKDQISISAPRGTIDQHGTVMESGVGGMVFESQRLLWQPVFEDTEITHGEGKTFTRMSFHSPKGVVAKTSGTIIFKSKDSTLVGAQIVSGGVSNPVGGSFTATPAYGSQTNYSITRKRGGFLGLGKSTREIHETKDIVEPTQIITDHFESLGSGTCTFEGAVIKALDMSITKNLMERAAYERSKSKVVQHSSGIFAPKIKGDPFVSALRGVRHIVTFGDAAPTAMNIVGAGAQTLTHATVLADLAKNPNKFGAVSQIFLSRFVTGPVFSNTTTTTARTESKPIQSKVDVGVLRVSNDRTHLEGIWHVDKASIETGTLTTSAPKHTVSQKTESRGWSLSLNPAALLGAYLAPTSLGLAPKIGSSLPNVAFQESESTSDSMHHEQMNMEANDLFIRCNDAIFSASTIRAQTVKMLVSGNLTVETLTDTFRSSSHSSQIAGSLSSIAGLIKGVPTERRFIDPRLGAVPTIRIADEERLTDNIDRAAALIGKEVFYLKVGELLYNKGGMISDGAIAGRRVYESVPTRDERHKRVINPMIGELVSMMGQVEEFNEVRAQYMLQRKVDGATSKQIETEMKQVEPDIREKTISEIRQKLTEEGATPAEIQQILQNDQMNKLLDSSKAAVTQQQLLGIRVKSIGGRKVGDSYHEKTEDTLLAKSSKMFVDAACYIDDFATENPRIAKFALTAASVAIGGPTRFVGHYVTEKSGITAKIEQAEDKVKEWSVDQFIEKFRMDEDTAELLASGIVFGAQITTAVLGARSAGKVLKDAKKISVHKNSLDYVGDTHVYKIKNVTKGVDHKIGESAQGLNKHGLSKRAEQQAKRLRKETGEDFKSEILEWHHGKRSARASETRLIRQAKGKDPDALPGNKGVH